MDQETWTTIQSVRKEILTEMGVQVKDQSFFDEKLKYYDFHDVFYQYADLFIKDEVDNKISWLHDGITFEEIYATYRLDQKLRNTFMNAVAMLEQTFKTAMQVPLSVALARWKVAQETTKSDKDKEFLQESYTLANGTKISRGDIKARIRHIKQNYDEPYDSYYEIHGHQVIPYLLIKEMSFGVTLNYFFLLEKNVQKEILDEVFKEKLSMNDFEKIAETLRLFNRRAAHNYRLLGFKDQDEYLYQKIIAIFKLIRNPEPLEVVQTRIKQYCSEFIANFPQDEVILEGLR